MQSDMDEILTESREDTVDRRKKIMQRKQSAFILCIGLFISSLLVFAMFLMFSDENTGVDNSADPYASVYSYLSNIYNGTGVPDSTVYSEIPSYSGNVILTLPASGDSPTSSENSDITVSMSSAAPQISQTIAENADLTLPPPNGKMYVDISESNKFIQIVHAEYKIDAKLLSAVYALPDTGQNYVLEWNGKTDSNGKIIRNADTLRRCFLIDVNGNISAIAATKSSERLNMSRAENKLAMETLIKKVILPEVEVQLN